MPEIWFYDPDNMESWSSRVIGHDEEGRLDYETAFLDSGGFIHTDYDNHDMYESASLTTQYDSSGRITKQIALYDDGRKIQTEYSNNTSGIIDHATWHYDGLGRLDNMAYFGKEGILSYTDYDNLNQYTSQYTTTHYSPTGIVLSQTSVYDDGTRIDTEFTTDGSKDYISVTTKFDSSFRKESSTFHFSEGNATFVKFDPTASPSHSSGGVIISSGGAIAVSVRVAASEIISLSADWTTITDDTST